MALHILIHRSIASQFWVLNTVIQNVTEYPQSRFAAAFHSTATTNERCLLTALEDDASLCESVTECSTK
jgi:hypothetical protein